jgi:hypothetical protein
MTLVGFDYLNVTRLNHRLRRTVLGPLGSTYPIEAVGGRESEAKIVHLDSVRTISPSPWGDSNRPVVVPAYQTPPGGSRRAGVRYRIL